jgi:arginase
VSTLRARCPDCRTLTAVAIGPDYECHSCGREFTAGLVRVPRAWGSGGEAMAAAARLALPFPEAAVVEEDTLAGQTLAIAADLPERPLVLGGCCCSHVGAIEGLAARHDRLGVVWIDAHGDLNTPATSPSGNQWGMPLRMAIDSGAVAASDVVLVGARNLDPPEEVFIAQAGVRQGEASVRDVGRATDAVYVALDADALDAAEVTSFMPEPGGLSVDEVERLFADLRGRAHIAGTGVPGLVPDERNQPVVERLLAALGFDG